MADMVRFPLSSIDFNWSSSPTLAPSPSPSLSTDPLNKHMSTTDNMYYKGQPMETRVYG